jgi:hypothetical protein
MHNEIQLARLVPMKVHIWAFSRLQQGSRDDSSVSLKSRIREAQREAAKRVKSDPRRHAGDKDASAMISPKNVIEDEVKEAVPTVEEIRTALLRKSANGRKTQ